MVTRIGGNETNDIITGTKFKDKLFGRGGDDKLFGWAKDDVLKGGSGDDKIFGNKGNDKLTGGTGKDTFVFGKDSGKDIVTDFDVKKDILTISKGLNKIESPEDVLNHATQHGSDVVISLGGGNKITLKNVSLDDLKKDPGDHFLVN